MSLSSIAQKESRLFDFLGTSGLAAGPLEVTSGTSEKSLLESSVKYLPAWIKVFDPERTGTGFIRIWDFAPRVIGDQMLEEVFQLVNNYTGR